MLDVTGCRFGRLTAIEPVGKNSRSSYYWRCACDCGNETVVIIGNLRSGHTKSCGCFETENKKKVYTRISAKHNGVGTRLYRIWQCMKTRCTNPHDSRKWEKYGGRGITVCQDWENDFSKFKEWASKNGYADNLTIDRIDPNGNYEPSNCRWVTVAEQQRNKRNNRYYTFRGKTQLIPAWAKEFGVTDSTLRSQIRRGKNYVDVFSQYAPSGGD